MRTLPLSLSSSSTHLLPPAFGSRSTLDGSLRVARSGGDLPARNLADPEGSPSLTPQPARAPANFSLANHDGFWELTFDGQRAVLPQDQGLFYFAWLLEHPGEPAISAHELAMRVHKKFDLHSDFAQEMP